MKVEGRRWRLTGCSLRLRGEVEVEGVQFEVKGV